MMLTKLNKIQPKTVTEKKTVRIGHPSGVMTMLPDLEKQAGEIIVKGVAVQRTARRIMEGTLFIRK